MKKETRVLTTDFEVREEDNKSIIEGYASGYGNWYSCGWYYEKIQEGAFDEALPKSDIRALFNHDPNLILGRKKANTLMVDADDKGLRYIVYPPDTTYAKDLLISMKRGDIDQSSFAFTVNEDGERWEIDSDGEYKRTIVKVSALYDVSPVTYPANNNTNVYARSKDDVDKLLQADVDSKANKDKLARAKAEQELMEAELITLE